ncbi:MAG: Asp23/Gls24 family envelope stress response protein [Fusobacteriaceae bacterium]|nr:Asp23/Gls24 family envelope stress response protein [Fusobacteriaceae bacterium]MBP6323141.1 Asp23/Gls24 family envelope stress response protein [Fusobacteriaceae bacterium]MBP9510433.1 Asp23/Gls24 family envelope stress response protein [Fusobacteriaceae bacterium]
MKELGNVKIADDVVKTIAAKAAGDVEGVYKLAGGVADEFSKILGKKRPTHGIKVEIGEKECVLEIYVIVEYGYKIADVATHIQKSVLKDVTEITGLKVTEINIFVQDIKVLSEEDEKVLEDNVPLM